MKIKRILQATFKKERGDEQFQIVLAFTDAKPGMKFATFQYFKDTGYSYGHYFSNFYLAYRDFDVRCLRCDVDDLIEYCARQIGEAEIVWEKL